jgi:hypothetical protein
MDTLAASVRLLSRARQTIFSKRLHLPRIVAGGKRSLLNIFAPLRALEKMNRVVRGPFVTPKRRQIYLVNGCILTESEVISLHERGKFTAEAIENFLADLKFLQTPGYAKQRRSQRVMLKLAVFVRAEMPDGGRQQVRASTVMVNANGGLLEVPFRMTVGQRITLVNPESRKEVNCRVVRVQGPSAGSFTTAFEFDGRSPSFWPVVHPPLDWAASAASPGDNS